MINWDEIKNFKPIDFPENPDTYADSLIIYTLQAYRAGIRKLIFPSPVKGALARFSGSTDSQHYVGEPLKPIRKSTAVDIFVEGIPMENLFYLFSFPIIQGLGIYLHTNGPDGKPWIMFHIDTRKEGFHDKIPLIWIAEKVWSTISKKLIQVYRYPQTEPKYWDLLKNERLLFDKRYGKPGVKAA